MPLVNTGSMRDQARDIRDRVVRMLARLSLVVVLALMGALFVGGAAAGGTDGGPSAGAGQVESRQGVLDQARPVGLTLGFAAIGSGLGVLLVGAFKPPRQREAELAELLRR